jgi:HSP20 family protein
MTVPVLQRSTHQAHPATGAGEPMREFEQIQEQTFELLRSVLGANPFADAGIWVPAVDIEETDDAWILEAELPGAKAEDIDIEAHDNEIEITGEIVEKERKGIIRRRTRRLGRFEYRVTLPGPVDRDKIDASLDEGILRVSVHKPENARPRRVEVNAAHGGNGAAGAPAAGS